MSLGKVNVPASLPSSPDRYPLGSHQISPGDTRPTSGALKGTRVNAVQPHPSHCGAQRCLPGSVLDTDAGMPSPLAKALSRQHTHTHSSPGKVGGQQQASRPRAQTALPPPPSHALRHHVHGSPGSAAVTVLSGLCGAPPTAWDGLCRIPR